MRILRLHKGGTGILKTLGVGRVLVQRVLMKQPRRFDVDATEAALASQ